MATEIQLFKFSNVPTGPSIRGIINTSGQAEIQLGGIPANNGVPAVAPGIVVTGNVNPVTGGTSISVLPYAQLNNYYAGTKMTFTPGAGGGASVANSGIITTPGGTDIVIGVAGKVFYESATANITGAGHTVGAIGWSVINATGRTTQLAIGSEGKLDVIAGTVTTGVLNESQLASNAGTINTLIGQRSAVVTNTGTIGYYVGHYFPDHSAISGITTKRCYQSDDTNAPMVVKSVIVSQSVFAVAPTTGQTITIPDNYGDYLVMPAGTLATLTINFPAVPIDGQEITIKTSQALTALTLSGNGKTMFDGVTTMAVNAFVTYKYYAGSTLWYRKG
jgi:hypothetical protein